MESQWLSSADFSTYARHQRKIAFRILAENYDLLSAFNYPLQVLDLECKTGEITKLISYLPNVFRVLAVDSRPDMLAVAETFSADSRIAYESGDPAQFFSLPQPAHEQFGLVSLMDGFHSDPRPEKSILTAHKCLKPGGIFIGFSCLDSLPPIIHDAVAQSPTWNKYYETLNLAIDRRDPFANWKSQSPENVIGQMLEVSGFEVLRCTLEEDVAILTEEEVRGILKIERGVMAEVPEKDLKAFSHFLQEILLKSCVPLTTGHYAKPAKILVFIARKMNK